MHALLAPAGRSVTEAERPTLTSTAWIASGELDLGEWLRYGRHLGTLGRGVNWWIGDWLRYGNACYGERYTRASKATGYDPQSLMNMVYVASRFAADRRRDGLSWSHHAELAALEAEEQEQWLTRAEALRLSVHSLRVELRTSRRAGRSICVAAEEGERAAHADDECIVCPKCRHIISQSRLLEGPARRSSHA
jgi:hypothetical protein